MTKKVKDTRAQVQVSLMHTDFRKSTVQQFQEENQ